jgi:carbon-monoxide dehydrogenase medium subunit
MRAKKEEARLLAGGTDLLVQIKQKTVQPSFVIDLKKIPELKKISFNPDRGLVMGSLVTAAEIAASPEINEFFPALSEAANMIGSPQIRNRATIGGNICRAAPSGDLPPILIALRSKLGLLESKAERSVFLEGFFSGPGITKLGTGGILAAIEVPLPTARWGAVYLRHSYREKLDVALVGVAVFVALNEKNDIFKTVRIVLASVGPTPLRANRAEEILRGRYIADQLISEASEAAALEAKPISDVYAEAWYKRCLVGVLVRRAIAQAFDRAKRG